MKLFVLKLLFVLLLSMMPYLGYADVPGTITFQAHLSDASGDSIEGATDITFFIPDTDWIEQHSSVSVNKGVFSVLLGNQMSLAEVDFSQVLQLHIEVNGISRTIPISSVPYAFHAKTVENDSDTLQALNCVSGQVAEWNGSRWVCADKASVSEGSGLKGEKGDKGEPGQHGRDGTDGQPGASPFGLTGNNAHYTAGNVGIGTANPQSKLQVSGTIHTTSGGVKFPDGTTQTTAATASNGVSIDAGLVYLRPGETDINISHDLNRIPKIVEISMSYMCNAKWVDKDQDGSGVLMAYHINEDHKLTPYRSANTNEICRLQTGVNDAQDFEIVTYSDKIKIKRGKKWGNYSSTSITEISWIVQ